VSTIFLLTFGRLADMLGRLRMYNLGFVIFTLGSVLCGLADTAFHLILFRLLQGRGTREGERTVGNIRPRTG
jgi:MFS family permease